MQSLKIYNGNDQKTSLVLCLAEDKYMAAGQEYIYPNGYLHDSRSRAKLVICTVAGCQHKIAIYTAAVQEPNRLLYTWLPCVLKK